MPTLMEVNAALKSKSEAMVLHLDRMDGEASPTADQLKTWREELDGIKGERDALIAQRDELEAREKLRGAVKADLDRINESVNRLSFAGQGAESRGDRYALKSAGELFAEDRAWKSWYQGAANPSTGLLPEKSYIQSPAVEFSGFLKTLLTGLTTWSPRADTSGGALVPVDQRGLLDTGVWQRPLRIVDMVSRGTTSGDVVEYVRMTGVTNNAAPVAEATATGGSSGAKPESAMAFEVIQDRVKTIAHWVPATRQALSDAGQLRSIIDTFLRYGLLEELEDQILNGSGSGGNFTGIYNTTGTLTQAFSSDLLTTARKARTNLLLNGRVMPNAWAINPSNWETFDLLQDNEARYFFGGPKQMGQPVLWGIPVVESEAVTAGNMLLGDFRYAMLWDREQTTIMASNSHSDFFIRNMIAILAELRAAFGVIRPKAFVEVALS